MGSFASIGSSFVLPPALAVWGEDNGYLFVLAVGSDQALWSRQLGQGRLDDGSPWGEWTPLGGFVTSQPCAVQSQQTKVDVFATGRESELLHWHADSGEWVARPFVNELAAARVSVERPPVFEQYWSSLGGILFSAPAVNADGDLQHVFGVGADSAIWRRIWDGSEWTDWHRLDGIYLSEPATIGRSINGTTTRDVAALGFDHQIWHMEEDDIP